MTKTETDSMRPVGQLARAVCPLATAKAELRKAMSIRLDGLEQDAIRRQSAALTRQVLLSSWFRSALRISVYVHTSGEVETDVIVRECLRSGKELFVPQFQRKNPRMRLLRLTDEQQFENLDCTLWNIRQPHQDSTAAEYVESGALDVVLLPGVAFNRSGDRLGHGMGYYDKMLAEHEKLFGKQPLKVALALNEQVVESVPVGEKDVTLDKVLFESASGGAGHRHSALDGM